MDLWYNNSSIEEDIDTPWKLDMPYILAIFLKKDGSICPFKYGLCNWTEIDLDLD